MRRDNIPKHVAIIMDGNGRWAKKRLLPRSSGHIAGLQSVKKVIQFAAKADIKVLTLFALSTENFSRRPSEELSHLMSLFIKQLRQHASELHEKNIRVSFIGCHEVLPEGHLETDAEYHANYSENPVPVGGTFAYGDYHPVSHGVVHECGSAAGPNIGVYHGGLSSTYTQQTGGAKRQKAGCIFCGIGHDLHILVAGIIKRRANSRDPAIHHIRRCDNVTAGIGLMDGLLA